MEYKVIKVLWDSIKVDSIKEYEARAREMIVHDDRADDARSKMYYYNKTEEALGEIRKCEDRAKAEGYLKEQIPIIFKNPATKEWCIFIAFLAKECNIPLEEKMCGKYINLLNKLLSTAGFGKLVNADMESILLAFAMRTPTSWEEWIDLQKQMKMTLENEKELEEEQDFHLPFGNIRKDKSTSYIELKEKVVRGLDEDGRKTRQTYQQMDLELQTIIEKYQKDEEKKLSRKFEDIFPGKFRRKCSFAAWRRKWYLYRMLLTVIDKNMDDVVNRINEKEFKITGEEYHSLKTILKRCCGIKTNYKEAAKQVNKRHPKESLRSYLETDGKIGIEQLGEIYTEVLGDDIFWSEKYLSSEEEGKPGGRMGNRMNVLLSDQGKVSREMLLLTALVARAHGCSDKINLGYMKNMLENSRFDTELNLDRPFDRYFEKALDISTKKGLKELTAEFEQEILDTYHCAALNNIIKGREVISE